MLKRPLAYIQQEEDAIRHTSTSGDIKLGKIESEDVAGAHIEHNK